MFRSFKLVDVQVRVWRSNLAIVSLTQPTHNNGDCSLGEDSTILDWSSCSYHLGIWVPPDFLCDVLWTEAVLKCKVELIIIQVRAVPHEMARAGHRHVIPCKIFISHSHQRTIYLLPQGPHTSMARCLSNLKTLLAEDHRLSWIFWMINWVMVCELLIALHKTLCDYLSR